MDFLTSRRAALMPGGSEPIRKGIAKGLHTFSSGGRVTLHPVEARVLDRLDMTGMIRFASELVRIPSVGGLETQAQRRVVDWMQENGIETDIWELDLPRLKTHPAFSAEVEREEGLGVVGTLGGKRGGRSLILNGHVDVVPPGDPDAWSFSPWSTGESGAGDPWT